VHGSIMAHGEPCSTIISHPSHSSGGPQALQVAQHCLHGLFADVTDECGTIAWDGEAGRCCHCWCKHTAKNSCGTAAAAAAHGCKHTAI